MENNNSYFIQIAIFFLLCLSLCGGVWYGLNTLQDYREEYDMIVNERDNFSSVMESLRAKNRTLASINKIDLSEVGTPSDAVEFSAQVIRLIGENSVNMLSMQTNDNNTLTLKLQGEYYSLVHLFADWSNMPFASRVTSLRITRDSVAPTDFVEADVTLEAWTKQ
ncbi:MAG: hypothetical protein IJP53_04945 [Synergistaceae bacterium]|nr:hypothetical protein [Synergistaceae bacterium]MBR0094977.1 hypothetical protein [Synergistaceae bacterium]